MTKGYADYVIAMALEIDREIKRELKGVEMPLFRQKYEEWLKAQGLAESSRVNYMRWLHKADSWIFDSDHDFWTLLNKAWNASDFGTAKALCKEYEDLLLEEKEHAKKEGKEEWGESATEIGNWISAFRKFVIFHDEQMENAEADKKALAEMIEASRLTAGHLFLGYRFVMWGVRQGKTQDSMESFASNIKRVNRELFCKTGLDRLHKLLPGYVKTRNHEEIDKMFKGMDRELTERIDRYDETEMSRGALMNGRSALRSYAEFIKSITATE